MTKEYRNLASPVSMSSTDAEFTGSDILSAIELRVNGIVLPTHKYLLKRFSVLDNLIAQKAGTSQLDKFLSLDREHGAEDFFNTFKILYTSPIDGPLEFGSAVLVSALRLATAYDHPALRIFVISNLENARLSVIERIQIAREFGFTSWEEPAYVELCERDEPITEQEANVLGISAFVQIAKIREQEQRRRGYLDNVQPTKDEEQQSLAEGCIPSSGEPIVAPVGNGKTMEDNREVSGREKTMENVNTAISLGDTDRVNKMSNNVVSMGERSAAQGLVPRFIGCSPADPTNLDERVAESGALGFKIPGCECKAPPNRLYRSYNGYNMTLDQGEACVCTISPCAAHALEQLEVHQVAQASSITKLESAMEEIRTALIPLQPVGDPSKLKPTESAETTLVRAEVYKWLYGKTEGRRTWKTTDCMHIHYIW
ncbi:hypothetical protein FRC12_016855 [Ceratobasidium sp. 428]|nr:hypothetical protein FRC12_016855 [Ceratobasidium sp. 428]